MVRLWGDTNGNKQNQKFVLNSWCLLRQFDASLLRSDHLSAQNEIHGARVMLFALVVGSGDPTELIMGLLCKVPNLSILDGADGFILGCLADEPVVPDGERRCHDFFHRAIEEHN